MKSTSHCFSFTELVGIIVWVMHILEALISRCLYIQRLKWRSGCLKRSGQWIIHACSAWMQSVQTNDSMYGWFLAYNDNTMVNKHTQCSSVDSYRYIREVLYKSCFLTSVVLAGQAWSIEVFGSSPQGSLSLSVPYSERHAIVPLILLNWAGLVPQHVHQSSDGDRNRTVRRCR